MVQSGRHVVEHIRQPVSGFRSAWLRALAGVLAGVTQPLLKSSPPLVHQHPGPLGRGGLLGFWDVGPELELLAVAGPQNPITLVLLGCSLS